MRYACVMAVSIMVLCAGCEKKQEPVPQETARPVKAMKLEAPLSGVTRVYPGTVDAADTAMLAFQAAGKVIELPVVPGQQVKQGDLLAKIDPREFEQAVAAAKARYEDAARNADRYKGLHAKNVVATADMEKIVKDADVLRANLQNAEKALQDTVLAAPFDGIVSQKLIENFQNVKAGDQAVRVQNIRQLKISISMPESDMASAPPGSRDTVKATATFSAAPGYSFPMKVAEFDTEADAKTQTFRVKFLMDQPADVKILPGMTAQVQLVFPPKGGQDAAAVFMVPSYAVFSDERGAGCVWVIDPDAQIVHKREVKLGGASGADQVAVTGGLAAGDTVALTGVGQLREGMKVRVIEGKIGE